MSRIIKHLINSSIVDDFPKRILYYPSEDKKFNEELYSLPFVYYITKNTSEHEQFGNVYFCPNAISGFLNIDFNVVIFTNPLVEFDQANNIAHQLHINNIFLCKDLPPKTKIENIYNWNNILGKNCRSICLSQELADSWLLTDYIVVNSLTDISGVLEEWTKLYIRK